LIGGGLIALQGIANSRIGEAIGAWQTAALTQLTGFAAAFLLALAAGKGVFRGLRQTKPLYLSGGALGAIIVFANATAIRHVGAALAIAAVLVAQLALTYAIEKLGWFGAVQRRMTFRHDAGMLLMIAGVILMK